MRFRLSLPAVMQPWQLKFASLYIYSPRGQSTISKRSRELRDGIKRGDAAVIARVAERASESEDLGTFAGFFDIQTVSLVPVPGSAPRRDKRTLWVPERIAIALHQARLACDVVPCLVRQTAVPKSAFAQPGQRPSLQVHFDSLRVDRTLAVSRRILLIDDVVTRGSILMASARRLREAFPDAEIQAFAVIRTMGLVPEVVQIHDPCVGTIVAKQDDEYPTRKP